LKVALVTSGHENLGVEYLSACLKEKGHQVQLFFDPQTFSGGLFLKVSPLQKRFSLQDAVVRKVMAWEPDIIGFSCMTHNYQWAIQVAQKIKQQGSQIPIIFGGIHPTCTPETVLSNSCVDMVAIGEAEKSFPELLDNLANKIMTTEVKGIWFKKNGDIITNPPYPITDNLDSLPMPDKKIFYAKMPVFAKTKYATMASRGCHFSCTYCCNNVLKKIYKGFQLRRIRSVNNVINELLIAKANYNFPYIHFYDEIFPSDHEWLEEFSEKYQQVIKLPFIISYHFNLIKEDKLRLLKEAGLFHIAFGLQSASEKIRREVCHRFHSNEDVKKAANLCKKYAIDFHIDHIFGLPYETEEDLKLAVDLYRETAPNVVFSYWLTYLPGTEIIEIAKEAGLIAETDIKFWEDGGKTFHDQGRYKYKKSFKQYELLFDLIPLLPGKLHKRLEKNKFLLKILPKNYFTHFFLTFLSGLKFQRPIYFDRIKYLLSKKYVP
jgi:anaerobic magnesium-protoporphyrin IX monomethyl ester cyclase